MKLLRYLLLACLLVWSQLGAVAHTLDHFTHRHDGTSQSDLCKQCVQYSPFSAAAAPQAAIGPSLEGGERHVVVPAQSVRAATALYTYLSRAPPFNSSHSL